jgi:glutamyl-tRNA(Gln) amidotransferase subunit D
MYSKDLHNLFSKKGIQIGDEVKVHCKKGTYKGFLMPRPSGSPNTLVIKLENGYNIGLDCKDFDIKLISKAEKKKPVPESKHVKGEVTILGCGGTIASKVDYKTGAVFPAISASELRNAFPELDKVASIHSRQIFELLSEDMNVSHWKKLAKEIAAEINSGSRGVVVMHGTDTLAYTASALSFMLQNLPAPVILVGAQRSSDRPSSDNRMNLLNSVFAAKQDIGEVAVCMHANTSDDYCQLIRGTRARKMHTSRRDAFKSINSLPLAKLMYKANVFETLSEYKKRSSGPLKLNTQMSENVALIYVYPGIKPELIRSLDSYDGAVLIVTGLGHVPTNPFGDKSAKPILPEVKNLIDSGIPVAIAPQTIHGRLDLNVYVNGRLLKESGVIGHGMDWTAECAYVKLCHVLGQTKDMKKIKELMEENIAGEIQDRSPLEVQ